VLSAAGALETRQRVRRLHAILLAELRQRGHLDLAVSIAGSSSIRALRGPVAPAGNRTPCRETAAMTRSRTVMPCAPPPHADAIGETPDRSWKRPWADALGRRTHVGVAPSISSPQHAVSASRGSTVSGADHDLGGVSTYFALHPYKEDALKRSGGHEFVGCEDQRSRGIPPAPTGSDELKSRRRP
jgi:hypothetical protein